MIYTEDAELTIQHIGTGLEVRPELHRDAVRATLTYLTTVEETGCPTATFEVTCTVDGEYDGNLHLFPVRARMRPDSALALSEGEMLDLFDKHVLA